MSEQFAKLLLDEIRKISLTLKSIQNLLTPVAIPRTIEILVYKNGQWVNPGGNMILQQGEKALLKLRISDAGGNPAEVEGGKVEWSVSDPAFGTLTVAEDMMSAEFVPAGAVGRAMIQAKGDADLGEGVEEIIGEIEIVQASGKAAKMELSAEAAPL